MRADPLVDPPEYLDWHADAATIAQWEETLRASPERARRVAALDDRELLTLYDGLVRARLEDRQLARWVRQGRLAKAWLATGEEATTIGPMHALQPVRDHLLPVIRNQSALAAWGLAPESVFRTALGAGTASSGGRDLHAGDAGRRCWAPVSAVGSMVPVAVGIALAEQRRATGAVVLTWLGDGATKTGAAHEGLNLGGVRRVPLVVVIQSNGIALGTPLAAHQLAPDFRDWPAMYGWHDGGAFDGNHVLDAWAATAHAVAHARAGGGPVLLEGRTFRFGGHATHDADAARMLVPQAHWAAWAAREPIGCYAAWLQARRGFDAAVLQAREDLLQHDVTAAAERAWQEAQVPTDPRVAVGGVMHGAADSRRTANLRAPGRDP